MIISSKFKPVWWLKNSHLQTIYSSFARKKSQVKIDYTERLELPDGDFLDLAWAINGLSADSPLVIFLHGLGGSINSSYVATQLAAYNQQGWRALFMHFRGASDTANRLARAYHSGETGDLDFLLKELQRREPDTKKAVVGISIGGNVLLKWLGEQGQQSLVDTAVAVSVPFDLSSIADKIDSGFAKVYQLYLMRRMRGVFQRKMAVNPELKRDYHEPLIAAKNFWEFDDKITAPMYGFNDVHDYYAKSSSRQFLSSIKTPTLIIHALDDPFMSKAVIPGEKELSEQVTLELSENGGHVGFVGADDAGKLHYWLDRRVPQYLQTILGDGANTLKNY